MVARAFSFWRELQAYNQARERLTFRAAFRVLHLCSFRAINSWRKATRSSKILQRRITRGLQLGEKQQQRLMLKRWRNDFGQMGWRQKHMRRALGRAMCKSLSLALLHWHSLATRHNMVIKKQQRAFAKILMKKQSDVFAELQHAVATSKRRTKLASRAVR